jgi:hypothetical protein
VDKIIDSRHTIFDLKTTRDCHGYAFGSQAYKLGYHIKMAIYWSGYKAITGEAPKLKIGAIESKAPHESAVYRITPDVLLQGLEELAELLQQLRECEKTDTWPPANQEESDLILPSWAVAQTDDLAEFAEETEEV